MTSEIGIVEFGASYRIGEWSIGLEPRSSGRAADRTLSFEAIAGGGYSYLNGEIDLKVSAASLGLAGQRVVEKSKDWIDPFGCARARINLSQRLSIQLRGDVGGFGVGSDFSWQAVGLIGYRVNFFGRDATVAGGYRALYQDFEDGSGASKFAWDMTLHGPVLGLNIRF